MKRLFNSKTKLAGWAMGVLNLAYALGLISIEPDQLIAANGGLLGALGVFLRMGVDKAKAAAEGQLSGPAAAAARRSGRVRGSLSVLLCASLLLPLAGCSNLRPLFRPTGPDRAMKVVSGASLDNVVLFEGTVAGTCQPFKIRGGDEDEATSAILRALDQVEISRHPESVDAVRRAVNRMVVATTLEDAEAQVSTINNILDTLAASFAHTDTLRDAVTEYLEGDAVGGCFLPVLVSGERAPRTVVCTLGEVFDKCRSFAPLETRVSFEGIDLRDGGGRYLPNGPAGIKGRAI